VAKHFGTLSFFRPPPAMARGLARRDTVCGQNWPTLGIFTFSLCTRSYHDIRRCRDTSRCNSEHFHFFDPRPPWHGAYRVEIRCVGKIGQHLELSCSPCAKRSYTWYFLGLSNRSCVALSLGHSIACTHDVPEHARGRVQVPGKDQWAARWWTCKKFCPPIIFHQTL
jgi:hypothetical protein